MNSRDLKNDEGSGDLIARLHSSESKEWYTPAPYIEAARQALGAILLDPASCEDAQKTVKASMFYSLANNEDGLTAAWLDRWFCNPPYGWRSFDGRRQSNQKLWVTKGLAEYKAGHRGIMLINSNTEAKYMIEPWARCWKCFTDHRIRFDPPPHSPPREQPTKGNVFLYFGEDWLAFGNAFAKFGHIVPPIPSWSDKELYRSILMDKISTY